MKRHAKLKMVDPQIVFLIMQFVDAVWAAAYALIDEDCDEKTRERIYRECVAATADDAKFREPWTDPDFQNACWTSLQSKGREVVDRLNLRDRMRRYYVATIFADRKPTSESEFEAIRKECGLTNEEIEQYEREDEVKFNREFNN
jgi:hypothetical protein